MLLLAVLTLLAADPGQQTGPNAGGAVPPVVAGAAATATATVPSPATAAEEASASEDIPLVPGHPGFTESRGVVQAGAIQYEAGYAFTARSSIRLRGRFRRSTSSGTAPAGTSWRLAT